MTNLYYGGGFTEEDIKEHAMTKSDWLKEMGFTRVRHGSQPYYIKDVNDDTTIEVYADDKNYFGLSQVCLKIRYDMCRTTTLELPKVNSPLKLKELLELL